MNASSGASTGTAIDELMDLASRALARCSYFEAQSHALAALRRALETRDYDRMGRICLPLQEARRQKMQLAEDAGHVRMIDAATAKAGITQPGMYLVQPPLTAADARTLRAGADRIGVPAIVLAREPMSRAGARSGKWPIAAVGPSVGSAWGGRDITVRTYVDPPPGVAPAESGPTRDVMERPPTPRWLLGACEALGDAAIDRVNPQDPASHRVEDLFELLDAWPLHEKLHQRLADACREAAAQPPPATERRRGAAENPWVF